jgi:hypothetical protein
MSHETIIDLTNQINSLYLLLNTLGKLNIQFLPPSVQIYEAVVLLEQALKKLQKIQ